MTKEVAVNLDSVIVTLIIDKAVYSFDMENNLGLQTNGSTQKIYNPIFIQELKVLACTLHFIL